MTFLLAYFTSLFAVAVRYSAPNSPQLPLGSRCRGGAPCQQRQLGSPPGQQQEEPGCCSGGFVWEQLQSVPRRVGTDPRFGQQPPRQLVESRRRPARQRHRRTAAVPPPPRGPPPPSGAGRVGVSRPPVGDAPALRAPARGELEADSAPAHLRFLSVSQVLCLGFFPPSEHFG